MIDNKNLSNEKENTTDQYSTTHSIDYPLYLQHIKYNLQQNLVNYQIDIINRQMGSGQLDQEHTGLYSIIITSQKAHLHHYQLLTQTLMNEQTFSFIVKHMIILNNRQVQLGDRLSINAAVNLVIKINRFMDQLQLIVDPVSGKIYFQTKSFINQTSLSYLKKNNARQDCFYTQIIAYSLKKAQHYMDLILYLTGRITLLQLITNPIIKNKFSFLLDAQEQLRNIQKGVGCFGLFSRDKQTFCSRSEQSYGQNDYENSYQGNSQNNQTNLQTSQTYESRKQQRRIESQNAFRGHLFNSIQFYTSNIQQVFKLYCRQSVYSNIGVVEGFKMFQKIYYGLQSERMVKQLEEASKKSQNRKRILTIIDVIGIDGGADEQEGEWRLLAEGGFGVVQTAMVRFKSLSSSYHSYLTSIIRQQLVRKSDKQTKRLKIKRQRKILLRLQLQYHPNITCFYISFQFGYEDVLFSDYTPHMSLDIYMQKNQMSISFSQKILLTVQAVEGLIFLHSHKIVHLDIKPGNMLVHKSLRVQLSDFGEAFVIGQDDMQTHQHAFTIPYCAPEIFYNSPILTEKVDIYAIGVCLLRQVLGEKYLQTFLKKKFTYRLSKSELYQHVISEKFENSFLSPILKIIEYVSILAVSQQRHQRPSLEWIKEILEMCRQFIMKLIY